MRAKRSPWLTLPLIWSISARWASLRPAAIGITLHLALDLPFLQFDRRVWRRAGARCERCGRLARKRQVVYILPPQHGGARWALSDRAAWCRACVREVYG